MIFRLICLILIPLLGPVAFGPPSAHAEVTINGDGSWAGEEAIPNIQHCSTRISIYRTAEFYSYINGPLMGIHYKPERTPPLKIHRISGDWAEVKWKTGSGWLRKEAFNAAAFEAIREDCETPKYDLTPPKEEVGDGDRGEKLAEEPKKSIIHDEYQTLLKFYRQKKRSERYVFVNKRKPENKMMYDTYVVDMATGEIKDKFDSLIGYKGYGCGDGQTRPGIFRLHHSVGEGASKYSHWGNNWKYYVMQNINGHSHQWGGLGCGLDNQMVAHSNRYMKGADSRGQRNSAGCFVTSPEKFTQWTEKLAGNALIYNVKY